MSTGLVSSRGSSSASETASPASVPLPSLQQITSEGRVAASTRDHVEAEVQHHQPASTSSLTPPPPPPPHFIASTAATEARRHGASIDASGKPRVKKTAALPTSRARTSALAARTIRTAKATRSTAHAALCVVPHRASASAAAAPQPPLSPPPSTPSAGPGTSLVEVVLDEQLCAPGPLTSSSMLPTSMNPPDPLLGEMDSRLETPMPVSTDVTKPRVRAGRTAAPPRPSQQRQERPSTGRAAARTSAPSNDTKVAHAHVAFDVAEDASLAASEVVEAASLWDLHASLRLQPFPPTVAASTHIASAMANVLGRSGVDSEGPALLWEPAHRGRTAAQEALAAERATLLPDGSESDPLEVDALLTRGAQQQQQQRIRKKHMDRIPSDERRLWRSSTSPQAGSRAALLTHAVTPADIAEFLAAEADAEAATRATTTTTVAEGRSEKEQRGSLTRNRPFTGGAIGDSGGASASLGSPSLGQPPSPARLSPTLSQLSSPAKQNSTTTTAGAATTTNKSDPLLQSESASVLRELEAMQQRLHQRGYRHTPSAQQQEQQPHAQAQQQYQRQPCEESQRLGYASSPCDISASPSSSSSASTTSADTMSRHQATSNVIDWTAASITDIVDALDRGTSALRHDTRHRRHNIQHKRDTHRPKDFNPALYAQALLEGNVNDDDDEEEEVEYDDEAWSISHAALPGKDNEDASIEGADHHVKRTSSPLSSKPGKQTQLSSTGSPSAQELRRASVQRASPSWAGAAAEIGLTPAEVRELLRYSANASEAKRWLSSGGHGNDDVEEGPHPGASAQPSPHADPHGHRNSSRGSGHVDHEAKNTFASREFNEQQQQRKEKRIVSYVLDAATQTALVHRIVSALPTVPDGLTVEMARQRKLLERVCREVSVAAAPVHAALMERATSPTAAASMARQPPPIAFDTTQNDNNNNNNNTRSDLPVAAQLHESFEMQQLRASLPPPALQTLAAAAGLHRAAADPSRPLPAFHDVVIRPPVSSPPWNRHSAGDVGGDAVGDGTRRGEQPYEAALHELAERETRHYVSELDRLRSVYDRQLADERRQRGQERQQYSALLQVQQQKMLQHHRETIHLLQREARLQAGQQDALVQQLAAAQAAATQRQQHEHARTTRQMLSGAVEAMKAQRVSAAQMDAVAGRTEQQQQQQRPGSRGIPAAAKLERLKRIRTRSANAALSATTTTTTTTATPSPQPDAVATNKTRPEGHHSSSPSSPPPPAAGEEKERDGVTATPPTATRTKQPRTRQAAVRICAPGDAAAQDKREEDKRDVSFRESDGPDGELVHFDADIPTAGHLTPLQQPKQEQQQTRMANGQAPASPGRVEAQDHDEGEREQSVATSDGGSCAPLPPVGAKSKNERHKDTQNLTQTNVLPRSATPAPAATAAGADALPSTVTGTRSPPPASAPTLRLNTSSTLRSVYGPSHARHRRDEEKDKEKWGDAPTAFTQTEKRGLSHTSPFNARMTLPLRVHLPPEDELDAHHRRVAAATTALDTRAAAAAETAGLADGTKLYVAAPRPRRAKEKFHATATRTATSSSTFTADVTASKHQQQQQQHQRRSRTLSSRGGGGGGVLRRRGRGEQPRRSASAVTRGPRFDFEAVSTLSNESEVSPYPYDPQQQQQQEQQQRFLEQHAHSGYPYSSTAQPEGFSVTRPAPTLLLPHTTSHFRGVWSEQLATVDGLHIDALWRTSSPAPRDVGQIAGKPSVGQPVLLISGPAATNDESPSTAAVAAAAISTQGLNAQLHHAERARARRVAELREAAEHIASQQRLSTSPAPAAPASGHAAAPGVSTTTIPDAASSVDEHPQHVGALPPCDSGFFGAPGGIALFQDASDSPHNPSTTTTTNAPHPLERDGRASGTGDGHEAFHDDLLLASHAEPLHHTGYKGVGGESARGAAMRATTDYARAWQRYESAADAVEHAAHALAAEDAGVLEAVAQEYHRRGGPPPPPLPPSAVSLPRLASAAAGVRYREQQQQRWSGENSVAAGNEEAPALRDEDHDNSGGGGGGGGMYVSARMAAEARALTAARQRLAQIRACFVSPPSFAFPELSASPTTAATSSATVVAPSGEIGSAAHVRAAAVRRLVDETVVSLLESESVNGPDPVRCVVSAIEHELLRMVLEEQLTDKSPPAPAAATSGHEMASPASTLSTVDPALVRAVVEAAIEDVVQSFVVKQQAGKESDTTDDQHQEQEHQQHEHERERAILARAVRRYAEENSQVPSVWAPSSTHLLLRETDRERVQLPVTAANAWLHDVDESSATDAATLQPPPEDTARAESGSGHGALVAAAAPAIPHTSSFSSSSPTALPMTMSVAGPAERGSAPPHDIRIVLDLSPEARRLLSPYDPSAAPAIANPARSGAAPLLSSMPHQWGTALARPPMQQEQLPGKWMALEDRRDVVVEADLRMAMTSQKQEAEQRADAGVRTCASVLTPPQPLSSENSLRPLRERTSENVHTAAGKLEGEREKHEEESTAAAVTTSSSPPHLSVPSLPPPSPRTAAAVAPSTETLRDVSPSLSTPVVPTTATAVPAHMSTLLPTPSGVDERSSPAATTPAPPRSSPTDSTAVVFHVLTTNLLENERLQRAGLHDREEEQRHSLLNLHLIVVHRHPPAPPQRNTWEARPISKIPAVASASSATQDAPQSVSTVFEGKPQEPQALSHPPSAASARSSPSPRPLPPVRDAVMRAVLEWVYQFHAPHNALSTQPTRRVADEQRTFSGPHSVAPGLVTGLHAAAEAAAMTQYTDARVHHHRALVSAGGDKEAWGKSSAEDSPAGMQSEGNGVFEGQPKLRDAAAAAAAASPSQPSTRNLGSAPATSAASTSTSSTSSLLSAPSLPSSFRTDSSSSLTETKTWEKRIQRASYEPRVSARTRPVVDVQESRQPHRTRLSGTSHASSSATTRYTTTASTTSSMPCSEDRKTRQRERCRGGDDEDSETGKQRGDAREDATKDALPMLSTVLPQRVSAEVAAALKAALRVHQREAAAASEEDPHNLERQQEQQQQQQPVTSLCSNENSVAQTSAAWPESSSYAVTLPARSADTTLLHNSAPVRAEGRGRSVRRRKPISPHPRGMDTTSCLNVVDVPPPLTRTAASNVWDGYSLTSTSTSSHGDIGRAADESRREGQAGHSARRDQQLSHRATTSALPFLA